MEQRRLGRTKHNSSVLIFGGAALWDEPQQAANDAIELVRKHGVNHFDVAPSYGKSEVLVGPWLADHRDEVFLGCKTMERTREGAWNELQQSLEKLQTDHLDLYQLHAITNYEELDAVFESGGAIEAFLEARDKGIVTYLGITGHGYESPAVHASALERFDFDTVMTPLNFVQWSDPVWREKFDRLTTIAGEKDVGLMIIKTFTKAPWLEDEDRTHNTWYKPFSKQEHINQAVRFVLSQPAVTGFTHPGDLRLLKPAIEAAENFTPMTEDEINALVETAQEFSPLFIAGDANL